MELLLEALSQIDQVAKQIVNFAGAKRIWLFEGQMGAGKTTLIKAICRQFDIIDETSSPTFSLVNVYENSIGEEFYHFDFYRVESEMEAIDIGCDEYFYSGKYCFIEWSERIPSLIPTPNLKISINLDDHNTRKIILTKHE